MKSRKQLPAFFTILSSLLVAAQVQAMEPEALASAIAVQEGESDALMARDDIVGTGIGMNEDGDPVMLVFATHRWHSGLPAQMDGLPVEVEVTGIIRALNQALEPGQETSPGFLSLADAAADPTERFERPVPIGVSIGNVGVCSAGTLGARVSNGVNEFILSNNHVIALSNQAPLGSNIVQPGIIEADCQQGNNDIVGRLEDFELIDFDGNDNVIDAGIALTSNVRVGTATPEDGYGSPQSQTVPADLGQRVQKYGRTTGLTLGVVTGVNVTINVQYEGQLIARFVRQTAIEGEGTNFSAAGDSGSLIVEEGTNAPVGLLFAGGGVTTFGNPIDEVLDRFEVSIDE